MKSIFVLSTALLLIASFGLCVQAQSERPRKVRVIGANKITPKPRLITRTKKTKRTILLPKSRLKAETTAELEKEVFDLINKERTNRGLKSLYFDDDLARVAREHSSDMATRGYFSHIDLNGNTVDGRALLEGVRNWTSIGENIAFNQGVDQPCAFTVQRWLTSRSHRQNLLRTEWVRTGVGIAVTKDGRYFFTQVFTR